MAPSLPVSAVTATFGIVAGRARWARWSDLLGVVLLYLAGALHWLWFFDRGRAKLTALDWFKEYAYYGVLRAGLQTHRWPWHTAVPFQGTDRFLANPETLLSPQVLLLRVLDVPSFVTLNTLLLYSAGFCGCVLLRRRHRLPFGVFALLAATLLANGHIVTHLAVGHSMWNGYFLLPFVALFVLDLPRDGRAPVRLAMTFFVMMLQGSFHLVFIVWAFLGFTLLGNPRLAGRIVTTLALAAAMSTFRLVPAAFALGSSRGWIFPGYPDVATLVASLRRFATYEDTTRGGYAWWEFDNFVGDAGLALIVVFGIGGALTARVRHGPRPLGLWLPTLALTALAWRTNHTALTRIVRLASIEDVPSRFMSVPVALLLVVGSIHLSRFLESRKHRRAWELGAIVAAVYTTVAMARHTAPWTLGRLEAVPSNHWSPARSVAIVQRTDPDYQRVVVASAAASSVMLLVWLVLAARARRSPTFR